MSEGPYLAIVNPAAGGGRTRKLLPGALDKLRAQGVPIEVRETSARGEATQIARAAYHGGQRKFIAVGGDGTSYEIVNGLFPEAMTQGRPTLAFLPLGTGNSFLRDFSVRGLDHAMESLIAGRSQSCDVLQLKHDQGIIFYINLLSVGFTADVANLRARNFSGWGEVGYQTAILLTLARFRRRPFPLRADGEPTTDNRPCLFLTFNNSKFTGGTMMIAPKAEVNDGLIEFVRWGPIGRVGLIRNLPTLYDGTHIQHPLAERRSVRHVDFDLQEPVDVMVDGEVLTVQCQTLDVLHDVMTIVA